METNQGNCFNLNDLTKEEQELLWRIQERKKQLLLEIQDLKREIDDVTNELEGADIDDERSSRLVSSSRGNRK